MFIVIKMFDMNCEVCCSSKIEEMLINNKTHYLCHNCGHLDKGSISNCCNEPNYHFVLKENVRGHLREVAICKNCNLSKPPIKRTGKPLPIVTYHQNEINAQWRQNNLAIAYDHINKVRQRVVERVNDSFEKLFELYGTYNDYLKSEEWQIKRQEVLERDNHKCLYCKYKASQVHHSTYANVGREKLEELQSICASCHQKLHNLC